MAGLVSVDVLTFTRHKVFDDGMTTKVIADGFALTAANSPRLCDAPAVAGRVDVFPVRHPLPQVQTIVEATLTFTVWSLPLLFLVFRSMVANVLLVCFCWSSMGVVSKL